VDVSESKLNLKSLFSRLDCQQAFHRECALNSEKCLKDRKTNTIGSSVSIKSRKTPKNPASKF
jgi:hypothetical protein